MLARSTQIIPYTHNRQKTIHDRLTEISGVLHSSTNLSVSLEEDNVLGGGGRAEVDQGVLVASIARSDQLHVCKRPQRNAHTRNVAGSYGPASY